MARSGPFLGMILRGGVIWGINPGMTRAAAIQLIAGSLRIAASVGLRAGLGRLITPWA